MLRPPEVGRNLAVVNLFQLTASLPAYQRIPAFLGMAFLLHQQTYLLPNLIKLDNLQTVHHDGPLPNALVSGNKKHDQTVEKVL